MADHYRTLAIPFLLSREVECASMMLSISRDLHHGGVLLYLIDSLGPDRQQSHLRHMGLCCYGNQEICPHRVPGYPGGGYDVCDWAGRYSHPDVWAVLTLIQTGIISIILHPTTTNSVHFYMSMWFNVQGWILAVPGSNVLSVKMC